jgi:hypothetical protein
MTDSHQATPPQPPLPLLPQRPRPSTYATSSIAATWRASSLLGEHKLLYRSFILFKALLSRSFPSLSFFPSAFPFFFLFFSFFLYVLLCLSMFGLLSHSSLLPLRFPSVNRSCYPVVISPLRPIYFDAPMYNFSISRQEKRHDIQANEASSVGFGRSGSKAHPSWSPPLRSPLPPSRCLRLRSVSDARKASEYLR